MADPLSSDLLPVSTSVRSASGFRFRPVFPGRIVVFFRLRHDSVRRFANLPNGDAGSLQSVRSACLSVRSACLSVRSACLSVRSVRPSVRPSVPPICPPIRPLRPFWPFRLSVCLVRLSARPPVRPFALSPSVPSVPSALSLRLSALSDPCLSFYPFCPPICPPIRPVPSASSLRLSALSDSRLFLYPLRSSRPPALTFLSAPPATCLPALRLSAHSCLSAPSAPSRPPAPPANFIPPISHSALFFRRRMFFSHPISDTLLKSRRGELGISDNN